MPFLSKDIIAFNGIGPYLEWTHDNSVGRW